MPVENTVQTQRDVLEIERLRIQAEINAYPTPIAGCDVYFNDLLERRNRLSELLSAAATRPDTSPAA